jgi:hypothetical protein
MGNKESSFTTALTMLTTIRDLKGQKLTEEIVNAIELMMVHVFYVEKEVKEVTCELQQFRNEEYKKATSVRLRPQKTRIALRKKETK